MDPERVEGPARAGGGRSGTHRQVGSRERQDSSRGRRRKREGSGTAAPRLDHLPLYTKKIAIQFNDVYISSNF